jgi:biopolymer transport protein ExbD
MRFRSENRLVAQFSFASLPDIVMLLLVFFLLSSSFVAQPGIKVQLPKAETAESPVDRNITVTLTEQGQIFLNAEQVTLQNLEQKVAGLLGSVEDKMVVIRADRQVTIQSTVQVIDVVKAAGATRFLIATQPALSQ